ncbi:UDP-glucose/GDP-mannose dehydrogenase family protein [Aneurinibacillus thermoaerophilus]|uniref:UDP-glucose dehydrogenase family protein n=1 Tax=Aneurinibacillus thermoaerophilus TaxID=143495 RepID=UPI002E2162DD|nr:UDP-glucose/GDP-mannose dehydrogenase family protein [Aneurinibacillus thermoaerophilus]MED0762906.1 UDP-glucose/GDP-mannose dehydrogenase family protein [Aneurinibacillus thermoaerophilus]
MKVAVIGCGYVGTSTSIAFAMYDHTVVAIDNDMGKIKKLKQAVLPFYEAGMEETLQKLVKDGTLSFTTDMKEAITQCDVLFIAVGTPSSSDGSADLSHVEEVAQQIGKTMESYKVVVIKSTVPIGTCDKIKKIIKNELEKRRLALSFDLVSNPEFLREGKALYDALHPERIVIGCDTKKAQKIMQELYKDIKTNILFVSNKDAEMIKYASNAFLATKISFINELARICEKIGANIIQVAKGMGMDSRIGSQFLQAGIGYGGSCFPKDIKALLTLASESGNPLHILQAVASVNQTQTDWFMEKVQKAIGPLSGKRIAVLGLTFKPETDDIREAPSLKIIDYLIKEKAFITAYDPKGVEHVKKLYPAIHYTFTPLEALQKADAALLVTEWKEIVNIDWQNAKHIMSQPFVFDGRNALNSSEMLTFGYHYVGVGTPHA